jgi:hypothetical protein
MAETTNESPVKCGYTVQLREDGTIEFDLIGEPSAIEIMGLHSLVNLKLYEPLIDEQAERREMKVLEHIKGLYTAVGRVVAKVNEQQVVEQQQKPTEENG